MSEVEINIPMAVAHRIIKKAGAMRVSEDALVEMVSALQEVGLKIGSKAVELAVHANRKTIMAQDVRLASKLVLEK